MKRLNLLYLLILLLTATPVLQSCDDDGYSLGDFIVEMATVHVVGGDTFYLELDNGETLWPAAPIIHSYKPVEGQRVIADYTLLSDQFQGYDHAIKINSLYDILTKGVEELTANNEEEFGNDPIKVENMWIGGNYLNIRFVFRIPENQKHRVSLVKAADGSFTDEEGYVNLEFRYNDYDDTSNYLRRSYVSYYLNTYGPNTVATVYVKGLKVKVNPSNEGGKELYIFDYNKDTNRLEEVDYTNDVVNEGVQ